MIFSEEILVFIRTMMIGLAATIWITKVFRELGAEALRRRLHGLDAELFEFARRGRIRTCDPAYAMLRDSIRATIQFSHRISLSRSLASTLLSGSPERKQTVESHMRDWAEALAQVECETTRTELANLHQRLLTVVSDYVTWGALPPATVVRKRRCPALRHARLVEVQARFAVRTPSTA